MKTVANGEKPNTKRCSDGLALLLTLGPRRTKPVISRGEC